MDGGLEGNAIYRAVYGLVVEDLGWEAWLGYFIAGSFVSFLPITEFLDNADTDAPEILDDTHTIPRKNRDRPSWAYLLEGRVRDGACLGETWDSQSPPRRSD